MSSVKTKDESQAFLGTIQFLSFFFHVHVQLLAYKIKVRDFSLEVEDGEGEVVLEVGVRANT